MDRPVFIFAAGWRTGSTLLQRVLCSHDAIHIWGENHGLCTYLEQADDALLGLQSVSEQHTAEFNKRGTDGWIAMMNPPHMRFQAGLKALLDTYFAQPALEQGKPRWGFKEVRHEITTAKFLHRIYPGAKFLLLVRDPVDCLASARVTSVPFLKKGLLAQVGDAPTFLEYWKRIAASFLEPWERNVALLLRYEELTSNPEQSIHQIADFLDVSPGGFDQAVFDVRRRGWLERSPKLTAADRSCLAGAAIWDVARKYGYEMRSE